MGDILVNLYSAKVETLCRQSPPQDCLIRPALAPELTLVTDWVRKEFGDYWASEALVAFSRQPVSCLIAVRERTLLGFACYDTTARGFFGPTGVAPDMRGQGLGSALLGAALSGMKTLGYAYAIIGDPGPQDFYVTTVGALPIPSEDKGLYRSMLRRPKPES